MSSARASIRRAGCASLPVSESIEDRIRQFLVTSLELEPGISDETQLVDGGFVASVQLLEIVDFIESAFGVVLQPIDVMPGSLSSIRAIAQIVRDRGASGEHAPRW